MKYVLRRDRANTNIYIKAKSLSAKFINLTTATLFFATTFAGASPLLFASTANASSTEIVNQDFSTCTTGTSNPTPAMTNWSFSGTNCYNTSGAGGSMALKMSDDGDSATLTLPLGANQTANTLSFHLNQVAAGDNSDSYLFLDEYNGATNLGDYDVSAQSDNVLPLNSAATKLVFTIGNVGGNNLALDNVVVTANNTNTAPVITSNGGGSTASINVEENTTAVTTVAATDADGDALTYSISGGIDANEFTIDSSTGVLTFKTPPDFENPGDADGDNNYQVTVQANDGTASASQAITVTVTGVSDTYTETAPPTMPSVSGNVIYNSIPSPLPSNLASLGYEATSTSAFGDKITFAGSDRQLDKVAVTMSSWACESGSGATCTTTPGDTFSVPLTLNLYSVANDGSVGSLIKSIHETAKIPYRPSTDLTCPDQAAWRDTNGVCNHGIDHVVTFDASGVTVPNTIIYSLAFNTRNYGTAPTGANGSYNSLNFALSTGAATTGTNVDTDSVYWDTTYSGYTAGLKKDTGWSADGNPAILFTAKPADTTPPVIGTITYTDSNSDTHDASGANIGGTVTFHVTQTEQTPSSLYVEYDQLVNGKWKKLANSSSDANNTDLAINTAQWGNGTYQVKVSSKDASGNKAGASASFYVDNTKPYVTVKDSSVGSISANIFSKVDFKLHDNHKIVSYTINGNTVPVSSHTTTLSDDNGVKVGARYGIYGPNTITVTDAAGNVSDPFTFTLDNKAPTITVQDNYVGDKSQATFSKVGFNFSDQYDVDYYVLNGQKVELGNAPYSNANFTDMQKYYGLTDGTNIIELFDVAGNSSSYTFKLDTVAPTGTFTYSNNNGNQVTSDDVTVTLNTNEPIQTPTSWTKVSDTVFTKIYPDNGKYSVTISDIAGNTTTLNYEVKRIDHTAPVINGVTDNGLYDQGVSFTVTEQSLAQILVDGVPVQFHGIGGWDYAPMNPVTGDGVHTIEAIDKANNSTTVTFTIDTTPPAAPAISPADGTKASGSDFTITVTPGDSSSVVTAVTDSLGNTYSVDLSGNYVIDTTQLAYGTQIYVTSTATDTAGNTTTSTATYTVNNRFSLLGGGGGGDVQPASKIKKTVPKAPINLNNVANAVLGHVKADSVNNAGKVKSDTITKLDHPASNVTKNSSFNYNWLWLLLLLLIPLAWFLSKKAAGGNKA